MDPITITVADIDPEGSVYLLGWAAFVEEVESKTDGKITFDTYTSASLMPGNEMLSGIGSGAADMGRIIPSYFPQELLVGNWYLGLGATAVDSFPHGLLQSSIVSHEAHVQEGPLRDELESHNVTPIMSYVQAQQYDLMCTDPVNSASDARGTLTRTLGELWVNEAQALDMVPVPLPPLEIYEGLQRGVIECALLQVPSHIDYSLWDVAKNYVPAAYSTLIAHPLVINTDVWQGLPAEAQQIMRDAAGTMWTTIMDNVLQRYATFATDGPAEHGVVFNDSREIDAILQTHQAQRVENMSSNAPEKVSDPQGFVDGILSLNDKWLTIIEQNYDGPMRDRDPESIRESYATAADVDVSALWTQIQEQGFAPYRDR